MPKRPRSSEEVARTRAVLVDAARRVFARKGYPSTTMADVANEAGYSAAALYKYFDDKRDLFDAALAGAVGDMYAAAKPFSAPTTRIEAEVDLLFGELFGFIEERADDFLKVVALQVGSTLVAAPELAEREAASNRYWVDQIRLRLEAAAGSPSLGGVTATEAAAYFDYLALGLFLCWSAERDACRFVDLIGPTKQAFLHGVGDVRGTSSPARSTSTGRSRRSPRSTRTTSTGRSRS